MNITANMQNKNLYILLAADFISSFGSAMTGTAISLIIYQRTGDLFVTALFAAVTLLPKLLLTPFMNRIELKANYKKIFCIAELICGVLLSILLFIDFNVIIFIIYALFSAVFLISECYRAEFLKIIASEEMLYKYQGISRIVNTLVTVAAPLSAGVILTFFSRKMIYAVDVVTYVLAALIILKIDSEYKPSKAIQAPKGNFQLLKQLLKGREHIFIGSVIVTLIGAVTSLLTLSYNVDVLKLGDMQYTILMSVMAAGSTIGGGVAMLSKVQKHIKKISTLSTFLMGILLLSVLFLPNFYCMLGILFVSGILCSLIMVYYSMEIFIRYNQEEIRYVSAYFNTFLDISQTAGKPIGGILEKAIGTVYSIAVMGAVFTVTTPVNYIPFSKQSQQD